jgi:hypothetical protein
MDVMPRPVSRAALAALDWLDRSHRVPTNCAPPQEGVFLAGQTSDTTRPERSPTEPPP